MAYTKKQREEKAEINDPDVPVKKSISIDTLPLQTRVRVRSNCYGELTYISKKTGYSASWNNYGSRQQINLDELVTMKNTYIKFYKANWIVIEGFVDAEYADVFSVEEILDYLQVKEFYKDSLCPNNIDDVFKLTPAEIEIRVPNMSSGVKNSIVARANELIKSRELDSLKAIESFEKALGCDLCRPE